MDIGGKLQIKAGASVAVLGLPDGVELEFPGGGTVTSDAEAAARADAVMVFVRESAELETVAAPAVAAALDDRLAWIAYPKGGQLGTDLNRDSLARLAVTRGIRPVRQIAIDDTWSALRFRPA